MWARVRLWLLGLLGGVQYVRYPVPEMRAVLGPLDFDQWERLSRIWEREPELADWLTLELRSLDTSEARLPAGPEGDRGRLAISVDRQRIAKVLRVSDIGAAMANKTQRPKERGPRNYGT